MCGRFTLGATATDLAAQFDLANVPPWTPRHNIAPRQEALVVLRPSPQAAREARLHRWGLIPPWANDPSIGNCMINARSETATTNASAPL
jgi:putative SOS response-associated peptidase YedK